AVLRLPGGATRAGQDLRRRDVQLQQPVHAGGPRRLRPIRCRHPDRRRRRPRHEPGRPLGRYPAMRGVLFDQPHVVARPRPLLEAAGVAGRCSVKGGNFFETAPGGADAYLLGHILHDWDDAWAGLILDTLRRATPAEARLLLVEHVLPEADGQAFGKLLDLHMMVLLGGLERTEAEYRRL